MSGAIWKHFSAIAGACLILILTGIDQLTKWMAETFLKGSQSVILLSDILELQYLENKGMAFGLLEGKRFLFIFFFLLFFAAAALFLWKMPAKKRYFMLWLAVVFMAAGACGNVLDRIFRAYVVDFIYVSIIDFPIFNVADILVVVGGIGMILLLFFKYEDEDFSFLHLK